MNKNNFTSLKMHPITNNGFTAQKYVIKEHIYSIFKFITWLHQSTTSYLLVTSLYYIFLTSNVILPQDIHFWTCVCGGNGHKWLVLSLFAVLWTSAHEVIEQGQKEHLQIYTDGTNSKKEKKMAFIKDSHVLECWKLGIDSMETSNTILTMDFGNED
eukprot:353317_1